MTTSNRWKHHVVTLKVSLPDMMMGRGVSDERLQAELDQQGMLGWELVHIIHHSTFFQLVFKRPM